jgi:hypothetical protein
MLSVLVYPFVAARLAAPFAVAGGSVDTSGETGEY